MKMFFAFMSVLPLSCCANPPKAIVLHKPSPETYATAGGDSKTTGAIEFGWFLTYTPFLYYGFDDAANSITKHVIARVHTCPFSATDKSDFDLRISAMRQVLAYEYRVRFPMLPSARPDLGNDHPSRSDTAKLAKNLSDLNEFFDKESCSPGEGGGL